MFVYLVRLFVIMRLLPLCVIEHLSMDFVVSSMLPLQLWNL